MTVRNWTGILSILGGMFLLGGCGGGEGSVSSSNVAALRETTANPSPQLLRSINLQSQLANAGEVILKAGENSLYSGCVDSTTAQAYFGTSGSQNPGRVLMVDTATLREVGSVVLPAGSTGLMACALDTVHRYAYFGAGRGQLLKFALGNGSAVPVLVGTVQMPCGSMTGILLDTVHGYGYAQGGGIVKFKLGAGNALPTYLGTLALNSLPGAGPVLGGLLADWSKGYLYEVCSSRMLKLTPGAGDALPTVVNTLATPNPPTTTFAAIDVASGYLYLAQGAYGPPTTGMVSKVRLNAGDATPTLIGSITLPSNNWSTGGIDPTTGYLYLTDDLTFPSSLVLQLAPGSGDALPSLMKTLPLTQGTYRPSYTFGTRPHPADATLAGEIYVRSGGIDTKNGFLILGTDTYPGQCIKIALPR